MAKFDVVFDATTRQVRTSHSRPDHRGPEGVVPTCGQVLRARSAPERQRRSATTGTQHVAARDETDQSLSFIDDRYAVDIAFQHYLRNAGGCHSRIGRNDGEVMTS